MPHCFSNNVNKHSRCVMSCTHHVTDRQNTLFAYSKLHKPSFWGNSSFNIMAKQGFRNSFDIFFSEAHLNLPKLISCIRRLHLNYLDSVELNNTYWNNVPPSIPHSCHS